MAYVPTRFFNGTPASTGDQVLYTVPAGKKAVVVDWTVTPTADIATVHLYIAGGTPVYFSKPMTNGKAYYFRGFYVLGAGDTLICNSTTPGNTWQTIHGFIGDTADTMAGGVPTRFFTVSPTASGITTAYTVPTGKTAIVKTSIQTNYSGGNAVVTVRPNNASHLHGYNVLLSSKETRQYDMAQILYAGDFLSVDQSVGSTTNFNAHGLLL